MVRSLAKSLYAICFAAAAAALSIACPAAAADEAGAYQNGFPASVTGDIYGQVKMADIDADGKNELVFGSSDGLVHIIGSDGREKRFGLWPKHTGGSILTSVAVGDIKNDGKQRIITGTMDGKVYCLDRYGKTEWQHDTKGPITFSNPQLYDPNGDGKLKTIIGSNSGRVCRLDEEGNVEWQVEAGAPVNTTVKVRDLENNNGADVIVRDTSGKISAYSNDSRSPKWTRQMGGKTGYWPFNFEVMDIDRDGKSEVIGQTPVPFKLHVLDSKGEIKNTQELPAESHAQVKMIDTRKAGELDMIVTYTYPDDRGAYIDIRSQKGESLPGWPKKVARYINGMPQVADIDGDGELDIIFTAWTDEPLEKAGFVNVLNKRGEQVPGFPKYVGKTVTPVTIGDLDGDGKVEIVVAGGIMRTAPQLHVFKAKAAPPSRVLVLGSQYENF